MSSLRSYARRVKSAEAKAEWKGTKEERTMDTVNNLAAKYGDTGGKWLFHVTVDLVDKCWESLALVMLVSVYPAPSLLTGGRVTR